MKSPSTVKNSLKKNVWENREYYDDSRRLVLKGNQKTPFLGEIKQRALRAKKVLDCGCGDGTDLELIWNPKTDFVGVDLSSAAVEMGQRRLAKKKNVKLLAGDLEKLPFPKKSFDCVYCLHVVEHLTNPEKAIDQMIRVLKPGGALIIYGSNFGHPFEFSPAGKKRPWYYLVRGIRLFLKTHLLLFMNPEGLGWEQVHPYFLKSGVYSADADTTVEPYLHSLLIYLKRKGFKIIKFSSSWEYEKKRLFTSLSFYEKIFEAVKFPVRILSRLNFSPYRYYGPALLVVGEKR